MFAGGEMVFERDTTNAFGHKRLGGIGDLVSEKLKEISPKYNCGKAVDVHKVHGRLVVLKNGRYDNMPMQ